MTRTYAQGSMVFKKLQVQRPLDKSRVNDAWTQSPARLTHSPRSGEVRSTLRSSSKRVVVTSIYGKSSAKKRGFFSRIGREAKNIRRWIANRSAQPVVT